MTQLHQIAGDVFHVLPYLPNCWAHGVVTDPPYLWNFMGRAHDRGHRAVEVLAALKSIGWTGENIQALLWNLEWLREVHRILVPGAYASIFCGAKSYDLVAFAGRLAGFEVQPMLTGIVGSAMAHGADVSKAIDREAGAEREVVGSKIDLDPRYKNSQYRRGAASRDLRSAPQRDHPTDITAPATPLAQAFDGHRTRYRDMLLPICVLLKPPEGSYAANARRWGVGGYAIDACRVETERGDDAERCRNNAAPSPRCHSGGFSPHVAGGSDNGRVPGNCLLLDEEAEAEVGRQSGETVGGGRVTGQPGNGAMYGAGNRGENSRPRTPGDASRYFPRFRYTARAAEQERLRGCEGFLWVADSSDPHGWRRVDHHEWLAAEPRRRLQGTIHTTLKPLELCRWLARLILPPPGDPARDIRLETTGSAGRLLVPFSGVLSEAIGAALGGWPEVVAIEQGPSFVEQGAARWQAWGPFEPARAEAIEASGGLKAAPAEHRQGKLFEASP